MNVKYILPCFLVSYLVIQCVTDETTEEKLERIVKENEAIRKTYELTATHFRVEDGQNLTLNHVYYVLGDCNKENIVQYFHKTKVPRIFQAMIDVELLGDIVRTVCENNNTKVLDFLERVNNSMRFILGRC